MCLCVCVCVCVGGGAGCLPVCQRLAFDSLSLSEAILEYTSLYFRCVCMETEDVCACMTAVCVFEAMMTTVCMCERR